MRQSYPLQQMARLVERISNRLEKFNGEQLTSISKPLVTRILEVLLSINGA